MPNTWFRRVEMPGTAQVICRPWKVDVVKGWQKDEYYMLW